MNSTVVAKLNITKLEMAMLSNTSIDQVNLQVLITVQAQCVVNNSQAKPNDCILGVQLLSLLVVSQGKKPLLLPKETV